MSDVIVKRLEIMLTEILFTEIIYNKKMTRTEKSLLQFFEFISKIENAEHKRLLNPEKLGKAVLTYFVAI